MERQKHKHLLFVISSPPLLFFFSLFLLIGHRNSVARAQNATSAPVRVGVVLDLGTTTGKRSRTSLAMAIEDFYAAHGNFSTRVAFDYRDSMNDTVGAAAAVVNLLKEGQVQAIIGPQTSTETEFVAYLCNKAQIPALSFSATTPAISPSHLPFFIRAAANDSAQSLPIAAFLQSFGWRSVVPIYEDSNYGSSILPSLVDALQPAAVRIPDRSIIPSSASDRYMDSELRRLINQPTRVFIVHMLPPLATRFFLRAHNLNMISKGYVWIVTDSVGDVLNTLDPTEINSMQGVIGFRPYVPFSNKISDFSARFRARFQKDYPGNPVNQPNVYQFWAYDAAWAMAMAVESVNVTSLGFITPQTGNGFTDLDRLGVSRTGNALLNAIWNTTFNGLAGKFNLVEGQLQLSAFEIVNVIGKGAPGVGFWKPESGIVNDFNSIKSSGNDNNKLNSIIWPGGSMEAPKGWEIPTNGKLLRIAVPVKHGFFQFVNVSKPISNSSNVTVTGYCIDVFDAVMNRLPYHVEYHYMPFKDSSYSYTNLVKQVYLKNYDAVVGDTTIIASRMDYVDFTLPYTESGVSMVVPVKPDTSKTMWIFLQPLTAKLWLTSLAFFFFTGFAVWVIEHRVNPEFRGTKWQQFGLIFYFAFSTLVFAHNQKFQSNLSRFMVIIWVFVVLILTSSYTASLTSMLTVQQLQPTVTNVNELLRRGDYVGYQDGSFIVGLLTRLNFDKRKMRNYSTVDQYADALAKGSANGGVAAIFDEIPYLKVFLSKYCANYTMVGPTYKTDGFGFAFPRGSPMVADVSRAILNVTEGDKMAQIENNWFGDPSSCPSQSTSSSSSSLSFCSFAGLFIITGAVSGLMFLIFIGRYIYHNWSELKKRSTNKTLWEKLRAWSSHYDGIDWSSPTFRNRTQSSVHSRDTNQNGSVREEIALAGFPSSLSLTSLSSQQSQDVNTNSTPDRMQELPEQMVPAEARQSEQATTEISEFTEQR